ncbi:hypothetical protein QLR68_23675, partial [Micromonospora sp. DH15]|nr:hypothetical protein [Micromonospora sp. DH15]
LKAAQAEAEALREAARAAFSEALRVTGTVVLRSGAVTLPPDQRLWSLSRRTGRPGLLTVELPLNEQGWSLRPLLPMPADVTAIRVVQHVDLPEHFVALQRLADFTGRPVYALADDTAAVWDPDLRDVRVWIDGDPAGEVLADLRDMVHLMLNGDSHAGEDAYVLPNGHGDRLHVTVARATSADDAHLAVQLVDEGPTDQFHWRHDATPEQRLHEFAHQLGLRDEYRDSTSSHRPDVPGSLLGDLTGVASDALTSDELAQLSDEEEIQLRGMQWAGLRPRHLQLLAALIGEPDADGAYRGTGPTSERIGVAPRAPQTAIDQAGQPLPAVDTESGDVAAGEAGSERIEVSRRVDRIRHPLTPAGLETAVQATLDAQAAVRPADPAASAASWNPPEDPLSCLALARRFAAVLHPGVDGFTRPGLRVGRTRDDAAIGIRWAGDFAGDRSDWAVVDSWARVEAALVAAAPGTAAFVLLERPGRAPGHAFAGYRLDRATDPVRWVQFGGERGAVVLPQVAADNQLPRLNALGPEVAARAVLVDPDGTVDPAALVDGGASALVASDSVARAIVDAPVNRTFLGHGAEFEFFEMLDLSAAIDLIEGATVETLPLAAQTYPLAADDAGTISIEVEKKDYYRDSQDGRLYRRPAPTRTRETVAIVEVVAGVVPDTDAEVGTHLADESLFPSIAAFENALSALTGPVRFADLLADFQATGHLTELRLTPVGERALIGPRPPDSDPGARVHHSIGVPLAGAYSFLAYVAAHTWRSPTSVAPSHARPHLDDALRFADALAARFAATGASARDVAELRGFAAMLYVNAAGYANRFIYRGGAKENLGAASRHDMAVLIEQLPAAARTFFTEGFTEVEGLFRAQFTARFPDLADRFRDRHGEELPGDFFQLPGGQTPTVVDYLAGRVSQRTAFGGMTVLPALDDVNAALPLVVLEVRYFGAQHVVGAA